jgi:hypothetical protein
MEKEYILLLAEEGYSCIETEQRKSGGSNMDNTKSARTLISPEFPPNRIFPLLDPLGAESHLEEKESQGRILETRRRHEAHDREGISEVLPQSKTHKDLEERPRELKSIMRKTNSTIGVFVTQRTTRSLVLCALLRVFA